MFVTDDRCAGAWAGAGARAGAARAGAGVRAGAGAWAGAGARIGAGAWAAGVFAATLAGAGNAGLQYRNLLLGAGGLVAGGGEGATMGVSQSTSMTCKIEYE